METLTQIVLALIVAVLGIQVYQFNLREPYSTADIQQLKQLQTDFQVRLNKTRDKLEEYKSLMEDTNLKLLSEIIQLEKKVILLEYKHNQKASILKFVINDMNDRLQTLSKGLQELKGQETPVAEYECYHWTPLDLDNIHWNYSVAVEEQQCEYYPENVFTKGNNEDYPGCGNCWCCKELDTPSPPKSPSDATKKQMKHKEI